MDIITTGQTKTSEDRLQKICEYIKSLKSKFKDKVGSQGIKYGNLLDFINTKATQNQEVDFGNVLETEFRDALRVLEEDNTVSLFGNSRAPTIRFIEHE